MMELEEIVRQLGANAEAIRALIQDISVEQAQWKPEPEVWSLREVMGHVYNEERIDFRKHLKEMLNDPPQAWGAFHPEEPVSVTDCQQALQGFITERASWIAWLKALKSPDWDRASQAPWGKISTGDVLVSWVEHDFLHLRQMIEVLYAWNVEQASPYAVEYAGGW